jgi:hypothetical protein
MRVRFRRMRASSQHRDHVSSHFHDDWVLFGKCLRPAPFAVSAIDVQNDSP